MSDVPLHQHAFLSDCAAAALVTAAGSVDWLCFPRFDSPPVLGRLLDDRAGHFSIVPAGNGYVNRWRYRLPGLVLESTWAGPDGELVVTDAMALGRHERGHELGLSSPGVLLRQARCTRGSVTVRVEYAPRPEFGLVHPRLEAVGETVVSHGGPTVLVLSTDLAMDVRGSTSRVSLTLDAGQSLEFALQQGEAWGPSPRAGSRARYGADWPRPRSRGGAGRSCTRTTTGRCAIWCTTVAWCCAVSPTPAAVPWSPHPPRACPKVSAAVARGTTATPGSAMRA